MEADIAKDLFEVSYTAQGAKGLLEGGGGKRRAAAEQAAKSVSGKIDSFYFAFGDADAFVIADVPDHASASAVSLAVSASGGAHCKTIVLMTPEEVDQASKKPLTYTGPGRFGVEAGVQIEAIERVRGLAGLDGGRSHRRTGYASVRVLLRQLQTCGSSYVVDRRA